MPIYYKSYLRPYASKLRKEMTMSDSIMWEQIRKKRIKNVQFYRQRPIGSYIVDFYAPTKNLVIEVDGSQHIENKEDKK